MEKFDTYEVFKGSRVFHAGITMAGVLLLLICFAFQASAGDAAWPGVKFSEVRAFAWPDDETTAAVVLKGMTLKAGAINPDGAVLTSAQTKALIDAVTGDRPQYPVASCHMPHNAVIFYDGTKKPVAFVEICFGCSSHRIAPEGAALNLDLVAIASIFNAHKLPMGEYRDLAAFKKSF